MPIGDIFQAKHLCFFGNQVGINVRHWQTVSELTGGATDLEIANDLSLSASGLYAGLLSTAATYAGTSVQKIRPLPARLEIVSNIGSGAGTRTGDPLPRQIAGLISLRTDFAGRRFRGRAYVPFPAESDNEADTTPSATYLISLGVLASFFRTARIVIGATGTTGLQAIVYHRDTFTGDSIRATLVRDGWATQRRRGTFGRPNEGHFGSVVIG